MEQERIGEVLQESDLENLIGRAAEWMRGRGFELLTKAAEGKVCRCCGKCKMRDSDMRAISLITGVVDKAMTLELARIDQRRQKGRKAEVVLEWPSEGSKS